MAAIALEHVSKRFPTGTLAVDDLSLDVADGEFLVLVGPSGCGKTTVLRLIAGLEEPTRGTIRINGCLADRMSVRDRDVALVFQQPALYPHLSVRANLAFGLQMRQATSPLKRWALRLLRRRSYAEMRRKTQEQATRVLDVARLLDLEDVLGRLPAQLSGGQQQRVALGRALVRQPAIFLFDEPLSNLDGPLRTEMRDQLHLLHRCFPATMLYVTHDPVEALALADRVAVLQGGVLQQVDRPLSIYDRPANRFVAGFIGWPPMSFVDGDLVAETGRLGLRAENRLLPLTSAMSARWERFAGQTVTVGIRPDAVSLTKQHEMASSMEMRLAMVEPLGGSYLAKFERGDWRVNAQLPRTCRAKPSPELEVAAQYEVFWDMSQAQLFERTSGAALCGSEGRSVPCRTADG
jgi:multiple sugar transport system ATP-binding protein